jgi:hypothetical protein
VSRRRRQEAAATPASALAFWSVLVNGAAVLLFAASLAGFVYLVVIGWWASPLELALAAVLAFAAIAGAAFFLDGIRRDLKDIGWGARGELREAGRRFRRRTGGRESFASQRFTGNSRRKQ